TLQMFVREPQDPDPNHILFLRWLAERGKLEHDVAGPPSGTYCAAAEGVIYVACSQSGRLGPGRLLLSAAASRDRRAEPA
ncbi:MAG TPA: hypothetical protein VEQ11_04225, partial [Chloroflexota bacterium]|nr:hypothetical protein [Chloroflexota bacterium]